MLAEQKKILILRLVWASLFIFSLLFTIFFKLPQEEYADLVLSLKLTLGALLIIFTFAIAICTLLVNCKVYQVNSHIIIVYAGFYHHYIKVDGEVADEHNTLITYTSIILSSALDDDQISATISLTNRIAFKYQNRLLKPIKARDIKLTRESKSEEIWK